MTSERERSGIIRGNFVASGEEGLFFRGAPLCVRSESCGIDSGFWGIDAEALF